MRAKSQSFEKVIKSGRIVPGMSFQERVWAITSRIQRGQVRTYGELARDLSSGARAVGGALHRNPYAPAVPCHRVVGSDGKLTGYAGGLPAKRRMLEAEGVKFRGDKVLLAGHRKSGN